MSTDDYLKLTAYFAERARHEHRFAADALLDLYGNSDIAISVMLRGIASFGPHHHLRTDETLSASEDPPIAIAAVDAADKIATLAERTVALIPRGLITLERAQLIRRESPAPTVADTGKLTVYVGRHRRIGGVPAYRAVCDLLHRHGFAATTVFLGVDGTAHGRRRRAAFFSRNSEVPLMIIGLGTGAQLTAVRAELTELLENNPLLTVERAQLCKLGGRLLTRPAELPGADDQGRPLWQKLMVHTSETAQYQGVPIHRAIVRTLIQTGAAGGATVLRGVWGYSGAESPRGDRLFQLGRHVPVTTIVVDTSERIAGAFEVIDEITREHGVVSAELVPSATVVDAGERHGGTDLAQFSY
ncbi:MULTISPECIES: DUF190 domain-containing protein [Mycolicibacterium]|uniref:Uncharacterized ACR, COG1993 n=1 Tax=Mycolicibacterium senegalense TaxID=1796 RepID=A0A378WG42_9MYCO|nr:MULTISPECIES: DUF190 domain-containing protein [Mycolicibacterium]MCV7336516.1 DUF190 domain-containing protein [Mycolicibacterium senegalense]MDR7291400.1 PII-like signaling protein [Mycolicibacterium senegalense]QZA22887.1 DUF190 domain-containing protein [Mycolicibacterium senegalense]CDP84119.1 hypothetical protein BN975_01351 [Mycolicibacterium farcinogenes]SUA32352.1 Uncharacterized ACR, COG1993 [Mycolicibacterium senegalense]